LKILQVHNYYQNPGGEDIVVKNEKTLLESHGHEVFQFHRHNDSIKKWSQKIKVLFSTHYSRESQRLFELEIKQIKPDVVHVHNFFPLITPSVFDVCRAYQVPSVLTLHNYRLICPNCFLMDNQCNIYERTIQGNAYSSIRDKIYRDSMLQTAVVAHMIEYHRKHKTWHNKVDQFIALTQFARQKFVEGGLPGEKITIKPNFAEEILQKTGSDFEAQKENYYVFVGRLSPEKGIEMLVKTWIDHNITTPLYIIGQGPMAEPLQEISKQTPAIVWLGTQPHHKTMEYVHRAKALVFPSIWYEGFPMTIVESFSLGTPVVTSNIGSQAEIVKDGYNGIHFQMGNMKDLHNKICESEKDTNILRKLSNQAYQTYRDYYTPETNYQQLVKIYRSVIEPMQYASKYESSDNNSMI
jgi:glycosyltransferase involved in cell wall biosynthesis